MAEITSAQRRAFEIMRHASFFNGSRVVDVLLAHRDCWVAALMLTRGYTLRDLPRDYWNADIVHISCRPEQAERLEALVRAEFDADEVDWLEGEDLQEATGFSRDLRVLRVWWD